MLNNNTSKDLTWYVQMIKITYNYYCLIRIHETIQIWAENYL